MWLRHLCHPRSRDLCSPARSFKLVAMKVMVASKEHMEAHYADLAGLKFFNGLVSFMVRTPATTWRFVSASVPSW